MGRSKRFLAAVFWACCAMAVLAYRPVQPQEQKPSDAEIRHLMVRASIAAYEGSCPCPETVNRGRRCGDNSAYKRDGGKGILCYTTDVTDEMVKRYRELLAKE